MKALMDDKLNIAHIYDFCLNFIPYDEILT